MLQCGDVYIPVHCQVYIFFHTNMCKKKTHIALVKTLQNVREVDDVNTHVLYV